MPKASLTRTAVAVTVLCLALLAAAQPAQAQARQTEEPAWSLRTLLGALSPFVAATPGAAERYQRVFEQEGPALPPDGNKLQTTGAGSDRIGGLRKVFSRR